MGPDNIFLLCVVIYLMGHSFYVRFFALASKPPKDILIAHANLFKRYVLKSPPGGNDNSNKKKSSENYGELNDEDDGELEIDLHNENENEGSAAAVPEDIIETEENIISIPETQNKKLIEEMAKGKIQESTASMRLTNSIDPMFLEQPEL